MIQFLLLSFLSGVFSLTSKGVLSLDSWTFDKIVDGSKNVLVMFDKEYPHGDPVDKFKDFAKLVGEMGAQSKNLVIAEVGKSDDGEKIHERFDVRSDDFPVFKLFKHGSTEPVTFIADEVDVESLSLFVQSEADVWIGIAGCLQEFDMLAKKFMQQKKRRSKIHGKASDLFESLEHDSLDSGKAYLRVMRKVIEKGDAFIDTEIARVNKLQEGILTDQKKDLFKRRLNILNTFKIASMVEGKKEL